ncbi:hypothetical protein [Burkholderia cenocepacia]|uniref:hypothetical protein n=1 Tax=Burkholderia cenocepacia TaxID=95486 RepID=UPI002B2491D8|nr:hypothetical protein [Burkholderia cenocepacia]MEB2558763.1 hypothetical protein [Burkholderia cenocepacia]
MSSSSKRVIALVAIVVGYVVTLFVGQASAPGAASSLTALVVENGGARCEFDNVYIGDGAVQVRHHCDSINRGGLAGARD